MTYGGGWRPHIESANALDIWRLHKSGSLRDGAHGVLHWTRNGECYASVSYFTERDDQFGLLTLSYSGENRNVEREDVTCKIRLSSIPLHYGGLRWYGHCPYTGRRARKLYKFHGIAQFCHRTAIHPLPTYATQRVGGSDRIMAQRWAIRHKLGDESSDLFSEPVKPRWMRHHTFEKFATRDAKLGEQQNEFLQRFLCRGRVSR